MCPKLETIYNPNLKRISVHNDTIACMVSKSKPISTIASLAFSFASSDFKAGPYNDHAKRCQCQLQLAVFTVVFSLVAENNIHVVRDLLQELISIVVSLSSYVQEIIASLPFVDAVTVFFVISVTAALSLLEWFTCQKQQQSPSSVDIQFKPKLVDEPRDNEDAKEPLSKEVALRDDPEYAKFFQMLKIGIPPPAVRQALLRENKDSDIIDMDPNKSYTEQRTKPKTARQPKLPLPAINNTLNLPKVLRKRVHWNKIDESKLKSESFWNLIQEKHTSLQLVGLDVDNEEFSSLFTLMVNKQCKPTGPTRDYIKSLARIPSFNRKIQLIDDRRRMNGSILLKKFKVNCKLLAQQVNGMDQITIHSDGLKALMQLLPTKEEAIALRRHLPSNHASSADIDQSICKLGECEQYMAHMLNVSYAKEKFKCIIFQQEFIQHVESIEHGIKVLIDACYSVQNSERFKKLLVYALKLGNALNGDGTGSKVRGITVDSLLKLAEAIAFDRQTSALYYLITIISKNDKDILRISKDLNSVKATEALVMDILSQQLDELVDGVKLVEEMINKCTPQNDTSKEQETEDETRKNSTQSTSTSMKIFLASAQPRITTITDKFQEAKATFANLLDFFGEDASLTPEAFFSTINSFMNTFDKTYEEFRSREKIKELKKRRSDTRLLKKAFASECNKHIRHSCLASSSSKF